MQRSQETVYFLMVENIKLNKFMNIKHKYKIRRSSLLFSGLSAPPSGYIKMVSEMSPVPSYKHLELSFHLLYTFCRLCFIKLSYLNCFAVYNFC